MKCQPSPTSVTFEGRGGDYQKKYFGQFLFSHFVYCIIDRRSLERQSLYALYQFVVMLQLIGECAWQSLLHKAHKKLGEGKVKLFLRLSRFSSAFCRRFTSAFTIPSFTVRLQRSRSHAASSQLSE